MAEAQADTQAEQKAAPSNGEAAVKPTVNPWLIAVVVALAAFMEVLDTSIANVALPHIGGSLGASQDQDTWVLTSYLVANAVVLPISGWLANMLGRKYFFQTCIVIFTVSSFLCGIAGSLPLLLIFRVAQGGGGGGLQPMAQAILADTFPPEKRGQAFAVFGITAVIAPIVGPVLGGWITDNFSWRWIFFINVPVGVIVWFLVQSLVQDPPYLKKLREKAVRVDYIGISLLFIGLGALQIMLDKGQEDDWLGSNFIRALAVITVVSLVWLVFHEWKFDSPVLDVKLFKNFGYATSNLMMFMLGVVLFSSIVLLPQFLQSLMGYTATLAGLVLSPSGVIIVLSLPLVGFLTTKTPSKWLICFGWLCTFTTLLYSAHVVDLSISFKTAVLLRIAQAMGLGFLFIPISTVVYVGLPEEKNNMVAGTINLMRNVGSGVGTSLVTTVLAQRSQMHQNRLIEGITKLNPQFNGAVTGLTQQLQHSQAGAGQDQALAMMYRSVQAQAQSLSYIDAYWLLGIAGSVMFILSFFLPKNDPKAGAKAPVH